MKNALRIILLLLIIFESVWIGMQIPRPLSEYPAFDPDLKPYLDDFVIDAKNHGIEVDPTILGAMIYAELPPGIIGFCNGTGPFWEARGIRGSSSILIDKRFLGADPTDYAVKALMYHELAHCLLYKQHDPSDAMTIMSETPIDDPYNRDYMNDFYRETWNNQLADLFWRSPLHEIPTEEELRYGVLQNLLPAPGFRVPEEEIGIPILHEAEVY